jgi:azobenzene reductase
MRMMLICGSLSKQSRTRSALRVAADFLVAQGVDVDFYDLGDHRFPLFDPNAAAVPEEVVDFRQRAMAAEAFILGTPEYHNGMSGALKNGLDYVGSRYFRDKPVALLACAGGGKGGIHALSNLRTVIRGIAGHAVPEQVVVDEDDFVDGVLVPEERRQRIRALATSVVRFTKMIAMEKAGG